VSRRRLPDTPKESPWEGTTSEGHTYTDRLVVRFLQRGDRHTRERCGATIGANGETESVTVPN